MTSLLVAGSNLVLGVVYLTYGLIMVRELKLGWRHSGFSHFTTAWIVIALTCGMHHVDHGLHGLVSGRDGGGLDLVAVLVGAPPGIAWFLLRVESLLGGRGDRFVSGTPVWLEALPAATASYTLLIVAGTILTVDPGDVFAPRIVPNLLLVLLYGATSYVFLRTQLRLRPVIGGWSTSGLTVSALMYTCAVMHAVFAAYANTGRYDLDWHGAMIDVVSVPAAIYFLWVAYGHYHGWIVDDRGAASVLPTDTRGQVAVP